MKKLLGIAAALSAAAVISCCAFATGGMVGGVVDAGEDIVNGVVNAGEDIVDGVTGRNTTTDAGTEITSKPDSGNSTSSGTTGSTGSTGTTGNTTTKPSDNPYTGVPFSAAAVGAAAIGAAGAAVASRRRR